MRGRRAAKDESTAIGPVLFNLGGDAFKLHRKGP
jgi:hypothetical protein